MIKATLYLYNKKNKHPITSEYIAGAFYLKSCPSINEKISFDKVNLWKVEDIAHIVERSDYGDIHDIMIFVSPV